MPSPTSHPFPTTDWSAVGRTGHGDDAQRRRALGVLVTKYMPAIHAYLMARHKVPSDQADDLLQAFLVSRVLEQNLVQRADQARGKFRRLLMASLDRFVVDEARRMDAALRSPPGCTVPVEAQDIPDPRQPVPDSFDLAWARQVLELAVRLTRRDCESSGRRDVWGLFEARVLGPAVGEQPPPYRHLVEQFGLASAEQASNVLITAKRMFARNLRSVVAEYADDEADVDMEIQRLKAILSGRGA